MLEFKIAWGILWIIYICLRAPFDYLHKKTKIIDTYDSTKEKVLLILLSVGLMVIPLFWVLTPLLDAFNYPSTAAFRMIGILLAVGSLLYFYRVHKELGKYWSPVLEVKENHQLIKTGVYKYIRHPMYLQIWIWVIAQAFIISNIVASLSGIIAWAIVYHSRVNREEKMMVKIFKSEYVDYMAKTGRIFPRIGKRKKSTSEV